jgi:hypothetical protein
VEPLLGAAVMGTWLLMAVEAQWDACFACRTGLCAALPPPNCFGVWRGRRKVTARESQGHLPGWIRALKPMRGHRWQAV